MRNNGRMEIELLEGRPTARVNLTLTPQLKEAAVTMALDGNQDLSQLVRHLLIREAARRAAVVEQAHQEMEDRLDLAKAQREGS